MEEREFDNVIVIEQNADPYMHCITFEPVDRLRCVEVVICQLGLAQKLQLWLGIGIRHSAFVGSGLNNSFIHSFIHSFI